MDEVKRSIYRSFVRNKQTPINFNRAALKEVLQVLRTSFIGEQSVSVVINGPNDEALSLLLQAQIVLLHESGREYVLFDEIHRRSHTGHPLIARIPGNLNDSDAAAILSLADQFCLRSGRERNTNALLEDLCEFFSQCRVSRTPAMIIIEDFHLFAHQQRRQTLVYTLLDLLHKSEYLFAVVGVTERLDTFSRLEKRILSRMYSLPLSLSLCTPEEVCSLFHFLLSVPETQTQRETETAIRRYNESVSEVFGEFSLSPLLSLSEKETDRDRDRYRDRDRESGKKRDREETERRDKFFVALHSLSPVSVSSENERDSDRDRERNTERRGDKEVVAIISQLIKLGRRPKYFVKVCLSLLPLLFEEKEREIDTEREIERDRPRVTKDLFKSAIQRCEPPSLSRTLSSLSLRELTLYVSIARRQSLSVSAALSGGLCIRPCQLSVSDVIGDFARLSLSTSLSSASSTSLSTSSTSEERKERLSLLCLPLLQSLVRLSLVSVWPPVSSLSSSLLSSRPQPLPASCLSVSLLSQYLVTCEHPAREIATAFALPPSTSSVSTSTSTPLSFLSQSETIKMPQRLRQAVLSPSLSLSDHTSLPSASLSTSVSASEHPQGGVETLHSLSLNTETLRELRERQRERHEEEERARNRPRLQRQIETERETEGQTERQIERQTETEQTERQTIRERQTETERETEMETDV